jgi:V-type H+-transporting ATPase subunit a
MFLSQKMGYYSLIIPRESAWEIMNRIGDLSALHLIDLNRDSPLIQREFSNYLRRCDEIDEKIRYIANLMDKHSIPIDYCSNARNYMWNLKNFLDTREKNEQSFLQEVETELDKRTDFMRDQVNTLENLLDQRRQFVEFLAVVQKNRQDISGLLTSQQRELRQFTRQMEHLSPAAAQHFQSANPRVNLSYIAGAINTNEALRFTRMLFRVTRGNIWTVLHEIEVREADDFDVDNVDNAKGNNQMYRNQPRRSSFLIIYHGGERTRARLTKICDSFTVSRFSMPEDPSLLHTKVEEAKQRLSELEIVTDDVNTRVMCVDDQRNPQSTRNQPAVLLRTSFPSTLTHLAQLDIPRHRAVITATWKSFACSS